jgi:hypothetical protein
MMVPGRIWRSCWLCANTFFLASGLAESVKVEKKNWFVAFKVASKKVCDGMGMLDDDNGASGEEEEELEVVEEVEEETEVEEEVGVGVGEHPGDASVEDAEDEEEGEEVDEPAVAGIIRELFALVERDTTAQKAWVRQKKEDLVAAWRNTPLCERGWCGVTVERIQGLARHHLHELRSPHSRP